MHLEADAARSGRPSLVTFNQKSLRFGFWARSFGALDAALQSWEGCKGMCLLLARLSFNFEGRLQGNKDPGPARMVKCVQTVWGQTCKIVDDMCTCRFLVKCDQGGSRFMLSYHRVVNTSPVPASLQICSTLFTDGCNHERYNIWDQVGL